MRVALLAVAAVVLAGCAQRTVYAKPGVDRHDLAIDALECNKQGVIAHKTTLARTSAADPEARQKASAAARAAVERCARARGYQKKQG